ncbi:MAG: hypothetical protein U0V48_01795 [Anaerolineales bacterium]
MTSTVKPTVDRMREIVRQLTGIGGGRSLDLVPTVYGHCPMGSVRCLIITCTKKMD